MDRERDYRVTYKSRDLDSREPADSYEVRRRIPTALDPYRYPDDRRELKTNVAEAKARNATKQYYDDGYRDRLQDRDRDGYSVLSAGRAGPTKTTTTYSVTDAGVEKESEIVRGPGAGAGGARDYRESDEYDNRKEISRVSGRGRDTGYDERAYSRRDEGYMRERPRREAGGYVVDVGDTDVIDVYTGRGAKESDRGFAGYRNDPYSDEDFRRPRYARDVAARESRYRDTDPVNSVRDVAARESRYRDADPVYSARDVARSSGASLQAGGPYMSGARGERAPAATAARSQPDFGEAPSRTSGRVYADDRASRTAPSRKLTRREEEDWGIIEKTSIHDGGPPMREDFREPFRDRAAETRRGRTRASTFASENDYVMVSPPRESAAASSTGAQTVRSAIFREDAYTPEERLRRRRSRSISFRDSDTTGHDRGDKLVERPGAEAAMMGQYLKHYDADADRMDYAYSSRSGRDRDPTDSREPGRYPPQRIRSRSRSRRRRDDDEDSYISTYRNKTTKDTYY